MRRVEKGFTLIELVIVLVVLGILAAVAIPKFEDLSTDAKNAAKAGGVSAVGSAVAIYTAKNKLSPTGTQVVTQLPGSACSTNVIEITGSSGQVKVTLLDSAGATVGSCAISVYAVGTGTYSG